MGRINYSNKVWELKQEIIRAIMWKVTDNKNCLLKVPYYYDEDEYDDDIEVLIDDEYEVFVGKSYDNLSITIENYCGYLIDVDIVALQVKDDRLIIITSKQDIYYASEVHNIDDLVKIYDAVVK